MPLKAFDKNALFYMLAVCQKFEPGLRIGWVVGPEQVIGRLADIKMQSDYGSSSLSQYVAAEMLASGSYAEYNKILRTKVRIRRDAALTALNKFSKALLHGIYLQVDISSGLD
jgi:GntR family transcriptional regulator of abcA and norABC